MKKSITLAILLSANSAGAQQIVVEPPWFIMLTPRSQIESVTPPSQISKCYQGCGSWEAWWLEQGPGYTYDAIYSTDLTGSMLYDTVVKDGTPTARISFQVLGLVGKDYWFMVRSKYGGANSRWVTYGWVYNDGQDCF